MEPDAMARARPPGCYRMKLFLVGEETNSRLARENLARICRNGEGRCFDVEIVDVLENYELALEHRILITPALLVLEPKRALIFGNLGDIEKVRSTLGL